MQLSSLVANPNYQLCLQLVSSHFAEWNCRAGQNNVVVRLAPCFPMYASTYDWGTIDQHKFEDGQLTDMKNTCQRHCFSTLNHNLTYCYNDSRVIKFVWKNLVTNRTKGSAQSFTG
jgi:hypothetical protein